MLGEAEFWVAVAFVIFVGVLIYWGPPWRGTDQRSGRIRMTSTSAPPQGEAAAAGRVSAQAAVRRAQAARSSPAPRPRPTGLGSSQDAHGEFVARRTRMAETKIAQAEVQALADVRAAAAEAAVAAAEKILTQTGKGSVADDLINKGIADLKSKLN
jgi:F-type H+-transporting ATPase subunit b